MHEGNHVVISELTSDRTGERSTAAKWFGAHLKRDFNNRNDNVEAVMQECVGKKVNLIVSTKSTGYKKVDAFKGSF
jgi:hypothetical protein